MPQGKVEKRAAAIARLEEAKWRTVRCSVVILSKKGN